MRGFIPESAGFPASDGIGLDEASSFFANGIESGMQRNTGYPALAIRLENSEAGDSPQSLRAAFGDETLVLAAVVDAGKLFLRAVLTPSDRLAFRIDQDAVRTPPLDESSLFAAVPNASLRPGAQPFFSRQPAGPVKMHAPAEIPAVPLGEQPLKIRPGLFG